MKRVKASKTRRMNFYGIVPRFLSGAVKCEESARQRSLLAEHGCNLAMSHRLPNYRIIRAAHSFRPRLIASSRDLIYLQCSSVSLVCLIPPSQSLSLSLSSSFYSLARGPPRCFWNSCYIGLTRLLDNVPNAKCQLDPLVRSDCTKLYPLEGAQCCWNRVWGRN